MALFEDVFKGGDLGPGLIVGVGVLMAPKIATAIGQMLRPVAKAAIKGGIVLYEDARDALGDLTEEAVAGTRAVVAEAQAEADTRPRGRRGRAAAPLHSADRAVAGNKPRPVLTRAKNPPKARSKKKAR